MKFLLVLFSALMIAPTQAIDTEYKVFYSNVKRLKDESTEALRFRFRFVDVASKQSCQFDSLYIHTQKKDMPILVSSSGHFSVPSEKALYWADAKIRSKGHPIKQKCQLESGIETKPEYLKRRYSRDELVYLDKQYSNFFSAMGSMMAFLMPKNNGLRVVFADPASHQISLQQLQERFPKTVIETSGTTLQLPSFLIEAISDELFFPAAPVKILPLVAR